MNPKLFVRIQFPIFAVVVSLAYPSAACADLSGPARVVDADTLDMAGERVRLFGIDAPERGQRCRRANGASYRCGAAATEALKARIADAPVQCDVSERDRYGRFVGTCYAADGADLSLWLVRNGHALAYRRYSTRYVAAETAARAAGAGMHAGAYVKPWRWRRGDRL